MTSTSKVEVRALGPYFGSEITGLDLSRPLTDADRAAVRDAFAKHLVLVFPRQDISPAAMKAFAAPYGPFFVHPDEAAKKLDGFPEVIALRKEPQDKHMFGGSDWHADVTWQRPAGYMTALHARELPPLGGDTLFASTVAAFSTLSDGLKKVLRGLDAVHSYEGPGKPEDPATTAVHPVVRRHPDTGAEGLYVHKMFVTRFTTMTAEESRPLIDFLAGHIIRPEFSYRHRWSKGDMLMWDNRFTLHCPVNDPVSSRRVMHRISTFEPVAGAALSQTAA